MSFLRLLDENRELSITNIAVIVVLVKLALDPDLDYAAIAALLGVIGSYSFKRYTQRKNRSSQLPSDLPLDELKDTLQALESDIAKVKLAQGFEINN